MTQHLLPSYLQVGSLLIGSLGRFETDDNDMKNTSKDNKISVLNEANEGPSRSFQSDEKHIEPKEEIPDQDLSTNSITTSNKPETGVTDFPEFFQQLDIEDELGYYQYEYLLKYINFQKSTLLDDKEGVLKFFMKKFQDQKLQMTFQDWLNLTLDTYNSKYINKTNKKLEQLLVEFSKLKDIIDHLDINNKTDLETLKLVIQSLE